MLLTIFLSLLFAFSNSNNTATLTIKFDELDSDKGIIVGQLFKEENHLEYPCNHEKKSDIEKGQTEIVFSNLESGDYSVFVYHDKNRNNVCDENFLGIPKELIGFSNNPKIRFSAPSFEKMKVSVEGEKTITIKMIDF